MRKAGESTAFITLLALIATITIAACSRGGRSPNWAEQNTSQAQPSPGSGQTGPGMTRQTNSVNGPNDSAYAYSDQGQHH